jgi:signal recognition particle subunit SEC65
MTITIYSQYFNDKLPRSKGRKIKLSAAKNFSESKLEEILRSLHAKYEVRDARYPRVPWEETRMYIVEADVKKSTLLKIIERRLS